MKYFTVFDANHNVYAYTPDERGAQTTAQDIGGYYREYEEGD